MRFQAKTEEEVKQGKLLVPGECDYGVREAKDETSGNGNEMIHLLLDVYDSNGDRAIVHDYLLEAMPHKLRHFAYSCGLGHVYEQGELSAENLAGRGGRCLVRNEQDRAKQYPPKNAVTDYVVADRTKETAGYQGAKAKSNGNAKGEFDAATMLKESQRRAWERFQDSYIKDHPSAVPDEIANAWRAACAAYWPGRAVPSTVGALEWDKFVKDKFAPLGSPLGEWEFKEDDIPF